MFADRLATVKVFQLNNRYGHMRLPCSHEAVNVFQRITIEFHNR